MKLKYSPIALFLYHESSVQAVELNEIAKMEKKNIN